MPVSEMFNATTKALCDFVEPAENEKMGIIKDIASAAAGISILVWCIVLAVEAVRVFQIWRQVPCGCEAARGARCPATGVEPCITG